MSDKNGGPVPNVGMNTSSLLRSLLLVGSVSLGACAGRSIDVGDGETAQQPNTATAAPAPQGSEAAIALASCNDPTHGPVDLLENKAETESKVTRRWFACPKPNGDRGGALWVAQGSDGIELTADGQWFHLRKDASGTLVRQFGAENQGTWDVPDDSPAASPTQVTKRSSGGSFLPSHVVFETGPARMKVEPYGPPGNDGWFVEVPAK